MGSTSPEVSVAQVPCSTQGTEFVTCSAGAMGNCDWLTVWVWDVVCELELPTSCTLRISTVTGGHTLEITVYVCTYRKREFTQHPGTKLCYSHAPTGWVPLLRLLEAVPQRQADDMVAVALGWQAVDMMCSEFMPMLPKEYISRALDCVALYAVTEVGGVTWGGGVEMVGVHSNGRLAGC